MNIKDAKQQIKNAVTAYFTKDKNGEYILPIEKQRPIFLMGPPGIGKTAIMEQIASEMGVGLLSYSMTHHTRQSALGLPFIEHKNYKGKEYDVSEYTMSEIIASVYDMMEETGIEEGILFLDEINCVSETLSPIMLQFLQYKIFGRHRVPDGWVVVTAGNPAEYNNSVRDFDIATWDRLKRIDVEPDFEVWKEYAYLKALHPSIISYLEIEKQNFYRVESTVEGKTFITARGWEDLSQMIKLYEMHNMPVDEKLVSQYVQNPKVCKGYTVYYDLFRKYRSDYQIDKILAGKVTEELVQRAKSAKFDERLSVLGLLLSAISNNIIEVMNKDKLLLDLVEDLKGFRMVVNNTKKKTPYDIMTDVIKKRKEQIDTGKKSGSISRENIAILKDLAEKLEEYQLLIKDEDDGNKAFNIIKEQFNKDVADFSKLAKDKTAKEIENVFVFLEKAFEGGHEMLIFVTELTANPHSAKYISRYGCKKYYEHNKDLLFHERQMEIDRVLESLNI